MTAFAHAMRVFDQHPDTASFWYLRRCEQGEVDKAATAVGLQIAELESLSSSLKLVRERWGDDFWLPDYDGTDACAIAKFSESLRYSKPSEFEALVGPPSADI